MWPRHCGASRSNFGLVLVAHVLQRPRPRKSPEEALQAAKGPMRHRDLASRRDGKRVFEKRHVFYDAGGLKTKYKSRRVFARTGSRPNTPDFCQKRR